MDADANLELVLASAEPVLPADQLLQLDKGLGRLAGRRKREEGAVTGGVDDAPVALRNRLRDEVDVQLLEAAPSLVTERGEVRGAVDDVGEGERKVPLEPSLEHLAKLSLELDDLRQAKRFGIHVPSDPPNIASGSRCCNDEL